MGPIGSAVLTFIEYKQTNNQIKNRQASKVYIYSSKIYSEQCTLSDLSLSFLYIHAILISSPFPPMMWYIIPLYVILSDPHTEFPFIDEAKIHCFFFCRNPQKRLSRVKTVSTANNFTFRPTIELLSVRELQKTNILKTRFRLNIFDNNFSFFLCVIFAKIDPDSFEKFFKFLRLVRLQSGRTLWHLIYITYPSYYFVALEMCTLKL